MAGVVPGDPRRLFAVVWVASSRSPAKAKLFLEDMIPVGEDGYSRRNDHFMGSMQLPQGDRRRATYSFPRRDTPFCRSAGRYTHLPPWTTFDELPGDLLTAFQQGVSHALKVSRSAFRYDEAMLTFLKWMAAAALDFHVCLKSWMSRDYSTFSGQRGFLRSIGPPSIGLCCATWMATARHGSKYMLVIHRFGVTWAGHVVCRRSSSSCYAPCRSWRWTWC